MEMTFTQGHVLPNIPSFVWVSYMFYRMPWSKHQVHPEHKRVKISEMSAGDNCGNVSRGTKFSDCKDNRMVTYANMGKLITGLVR